MSYISISLYRKVINHALAEGMAEEKFRDLPISIDAMENVRAVPSDQFFALHEMIDSRIGSGFAVRVGQQMKIDDYGVLGLSWRTCARAGEIFERSERYFKLLSDTYLFKVEKQNNVSYVYLHRDAHRRGVALSNEATMSATVVVLQAMTEVDIMPVAVSFKHGPPDNIVSHEEAFKCDIRFNQPYNFIAYKTKDLEMRTAKADTSINQFLMERVDEETRGIEVSASKVVRDVEQLIQDALPSGIPSIVQIGAHMGMSNRTLTRRLSENGFTFRDLIRKTQEEVAMSMLKDSTRSIAEIAFQTGFSEQSAFNRAFKRWTDQSPLDYRKNH